MSYKRLFQHALFILIISNLGFAQLQLKNNPDPLPGWTHDAFLTNDTDQQHGIIVDGREFINSSPVIAEIDGDTKNGKEVAIGGSDGTLYVFKSDGSLLWKSDLQSAKCRRANKKDRLSSSPAVGELFGDGIPYVVIGYGSQKKKTCKGGVAAFRGSNGEKIWDLELKRFDKKNGFFAVSHAVFSTPSLADTDFDGQLEIGFGSLDRNVYLLEANGDIRFLYHAADTVFASPIFYNVDDDPELEMIFSTDITANDNFKRPTKDGGMMYAFNTDKDLPYFIDFRGKQRRVWKRYFKQTLHSSPVIADVLESNPGDEIITLSGCFFPEASNNKLGRWIKILNPANRRILKTIKTDSCASASVAIADVNEDGKLDILSTTNAGRQFGNKKKTTLTAWDANTGSVIWKTIPKHAGGNDKFIGTFRAPVVADIDGNGSLEVLLSNLNGVVVFAGMTGEQLTCGKRDCRLEVNSATLHASKQVVATPAIGDVNDDGILDVVIGGRHEGKPTNGLLYSWTDIHDNLNSEVGTYPPYFAPWPQHRKDAMSNAVY